MNKLLLVVALLTLPCAAWAQQQQPDPAFLQRAIKLLQQQRNQALDQAVVEKAQCDGLAEDLAKAQARIKELEAAPQPEAKPHQD